MKRARLPTMLLAAALPIVLFAAAMTVLFDRQQTRSWEAVMHQATAAARATVDERVMTIRITLETLAISGRSADRRRADFPVQAERVLAMRPDWMALRLTLRDGSAEADVRRDGLEVPRNAGAAGVEADIAAVFRYGEPRVSGVLADPARADEPVFAVSVPLFGDDGVERVVTAHVRAWTINQALRDQGISPGWRIAVLDRDGSLVARTLSEDSRDPGIGGPPDATLLDGLRRGLPMFHATNALNEDLYVASSVSGLTGWTVALGMPASLIDLPAKRTLAAVVGGGILAVALALGIGWLLARSLMKRSAAERRLLQLELAQASNERTAAILESTSDGVFEVNPGWRIIFINSRARSLLTGGVDVTGRLLWDVLPEADTTAFWHEFHRVATERVPAEFEEFYPALGAWFYVRAFPLPDGGIAVYFQDVTEGRRARDALADSERRYRFLAESIPQIVWTATPDGGVDYVNGRLKTYLGAKEESFSDGWRWLENLHPDDVESTRQAWKSAQTTSSVYEHEHRFRRHDGMFRWHLARALPMLDETGQVVRWFGTSTDIHDQKLQQEALQAARDEAERARGVAEQADLAKSRFLAAASHDLRQPMQSLFLFADSLKAHIADREGADKLLHLRRGLDALKVLLDGLLDVSRLDADAVQPTVEDVPLDPLLDRIGGAYAKVAAAKGLSFEIRACGGTVRTDRTLLGRILNNLLENAVHYTETGRIRIDCRRTGDTVRIEVQDTGIGIPPDHLEDIWTEFHQVGNPERDRNQGLGLGLAIVDRLARLLGHRVEALSALGRGSVFSIELPAGAAVETPAVAPAAAAGGPASAPPPPAPASPAGERRYAVLVDDDAIVLLGLQSILRDWGYDVLAAGSTEQALDRLGTSDRRPDIVVADYRLRGGRVGTEAILKIRELFGSDIPGVILTGETGPECARDAAAHGFSVAHKPITSHQLSLAMEKLLSDAAD
ncbi:PAS domain-containing protein [Skermanella rosea]|uniref:hybrid sensor histidine kinase/response regulator n=1 Tax=Skermanella rosea TaxID=1817965 RepID=UPI00193303D1|nr:ATP-binding protein [Skermanella rosea]UEM02647.1 PAS domain-containing protein [Skermanella rosea]